MYCTFRRVVLSTKVKIEATIADKLYLGPGQSYSDPIVGAVTFCPEANAAVSCMQQAKAKETEKWGAYIKNDEKMDGDQNRKAFEREYISLTPPTTSWKVSRTAGKIKFGEIFVPVWSMSA